MVDLTLINNADDTDKSAHSDLWARFFKATKWEELHMLATQDKNINEAALKLHYLVQDQIIRDKLWAREDYLRCQRDREDYYNTEIKQRDEEIVTLKKSNSDKDTTIATQNTTIADMAAKIAELEAQLADKKS